MKEKNPNHIKQIIEANPTFDKPIPEHDDFIEIAEFFKDTIQGEGINIGYPATFLRVKHCLLNCYFCDTQSVWRFGNPYTFDELFELIEKHGLVERFKKGQHLILTGGSPLKQQDKLIKFINLFIEKYGFKPYIEIENEVATLPKKEIIELVDCWNNSPKLKNSGNPDILRYRPGFLKFMSELPNNWFKFVISCNEDWEEIKSDYLDKDLIKRDQIILMPMGGSLEELESNRHTVVEIAIRENVRFTDRLHVTLWDILTGV